MHDPLCVAFTIRRPWPKSYLVPGKRYWPALVTVWHREPNGHDSGTICPYRAHWRHPWHWRIQVHSLQELRRRLLTHCEWCHGRHARRDPVNNSLQWDGDRGPWWRGERGLYHSDCASIAIAHGQCTCEDPVCGDYSPEYGPYGKCAHCGKGRSFGVTQQAMAVRRRYAAVPAGQRDAGVSA